MHDPHSSLDAIPQDSGSFSELVGFSSFGAAGLAIGLALQGTLSNVAAGVMLLIFRPFKEGDFVEAGGTAGTVKGITLFVSELATPDNVQILVPNSQVWGTIVKNYSHHETRRVDLVMGIDYTDDIDKADHTEYMGPRSLA